MRQAQDLVRLGIGPVEGIRRQVEGRGGAGANNAEGDEGEDARAAYLGGALCVLALAWIGALSFGHR